jgi:D-alanyl-D-alanine carboxypeptidase
MGHPRWMTAARGRRHACVLLVFVAMVVAATACNREVSSAKEVGARRAERLERALESLPAPGALGLLRLGEDAWTAAAGERESGRAADPHDRFEIASITKTFVAVVVLQLVGEGRLSLEDTVEDVLPGALPYGGRITLRHLLDHTSGLGDARMLERPPRETLEELAKVRPYSRPGSVHSYANVNFIVLGLIVEEVTGLPLQQVVRDRLFAPLHLDHTSFGSARDASFEPAPWLGEAATVPADLAGAGGIVSTADEVSTFFRALLGGELIEPQLLAEMTTTVDADGDRAGLGIFELTLPCGTAWGHGGAWPTYSSMAFASRDGSKVVVVAQSGGDWTQARDVAEEIYCSG